MQDNELPKKISFSVLKDNKSRDFKLVGIPDLVIDFKTERFGIIDFKTTKISDQKAEFYKFQLEAYATIFENPGKINSVKTPLLTPITKLAILQFDPNKIETKNQKDCNITFNTHYVELKNRISTNNDTQVLLPAIKAEAEFSSSEKLRFQYRQRMRFPNIGKLATNFFSGPLKNNNG